MDNLKNFGNNIRNIRISKGLTQEELAEKSGINRTAIGNIENGKHKISLSTAMELSNALSFPIDELVFGKSVLEIKWEEGGDDEIG